MEIGLIGYQIANGKFDRHMKLRSNTHGCELNIKANSTTSETQMLKYKF